MKLIKEIIERRMEIMKDLELNNEQAKSIWHFYQIYIISANFLGINPEMKAKNELLKRLISNPNNLAIIGKLKTYLARDNQVIEMALNSINENVEEEEIFEDFYPVSVFGVNIWDRGN